MADLHGFVVRNEAEEVVGVDEGQIALALLKGQKELLSEKVESQWGPVHLFDLCLRCDHLGMALALAAHSVPGCFLEDHHLGLISKHSPELFFSQALFLLLPGMDPYCCFAFPWDHGIWMKDWDVDLEDAIPAAQKAAATPLTRAMLDLCSCDGELPFSGSQEAMARLLDVAILTGNQQATVNLSKKSQLRPLRRWKMEWRFEVHWKAARTALWAGADFHFQMVKDPFFFQDVPFPTALVGGSDVPFPLALFLRSKLEDWQEIRHLLPQGNDLRDLLVEGQDLWRPRNWDNEFGVFFFEHPPVQLSLSKIRAAEDAGVAVQFCFVWILEEGDDNGSAEVVSLLDMAIWFGHANCAEACVDGGIELGGDDKPLAWHKGVLRGESLSLRVPRFNLLPVNVVPSEAQTAAAAAGRAWLKRLLKSECSQKGIVLYQMMLKMLKGKSFSMGLVQKILSYSMPVPKIIDQLDLWEHVGDWMATICGRPASVLAAADGNTANVEKPQGVQGNGEAGSSVSPPPVLAETVHGDVKTNDDLMMALHASRDQVPALNFHGVCVFRLTRLATSSHVSDLLLNPSGPLASLHHRVLEAGCQVDPEWNPVKVLFIPITESQMDELISLAEQGYELNKEDHILALQEDETIITEALRSHICNKNRPKLKKVGPQFQPDQDVQMEENDPLLVRETGLRTDSSVGFPSYSR